MVNYKHRSNNVLAPLTHKAMEIDVKFENGDIVLGHDGSDVACTFEAFLANCNKNTELAINIKQSGMAKELVKLLANYKLKSYFFFDMAVPDLLEYITLTPEHTAYRVSEYERYDVDFDRCGWVWLDYFKDFEHNDVPYISTAKQVVASPMLHGSSYQYKMLTKKAYGLVKK